MIVQYEFELDLTNPQDKKNPEEKWKPHPRFTSYEVSNLGNVRNIYTKKNNSLNKKDIKTDNSYIKTNINDPSFKRNWGYVSVHKLVAETWLGKEYDKNKQIHHIDGDCSNNTIFNLQQLTKAEHKAEHSAMYAMFNKKGVLLKIFTNKDELNNHNLLLRSVQVYSSRPNYLHKKHIFRNLRRFPKITQWQIGNTYDFVINNSKGDFCV